jgi:hypothetical protein
MIKGGVVLYALFAAALGYMFRGHEFGFGVMAGGLVSLVEFWSTAWLVKKILLSPEARLKAGLGLGIKSLVVLSLVGLLVLFEAVEGVAFLIGLLGLFFGIIIGLVLYFIFMPAGEGAGA